MTREFIFGFVSAFIMLVFSLWLFAPREGYQRRVCPTDELLQNKEVVSYLVRIGQ